MIVCTKKKTKKKTEGRAAENEKQKSLDYQSI